MRKNVAALFLSTFIVLGVNAKEVVKSIFSPEEIHSLGTKEGKELWKKIDEFNNDDFKRKRSDPKLKEYFKNLDRGQDKAAFNAILRPANEGYSAAETELAYLYLTGTGVSQDIDTAISWYRKAAEKGETLAEASLGGIYFRDNLGKRNPEKAFYWLSRCSVKLWPSCTLLSGVLYLQQRNIPMAHAWLSIANSLKTPGASEILSDLDKIMTQEQRRKAEKELANIKQMIIK